MSVGRKVTTAYEMYVNSNVVNAVRAGQGAYNYHELAAMVGLKPTQHFRRRINQLVQSGILILVPSFTLRGGIENRFMIAVSKNQLELPEC